MAGQLGVWPAECVSVEDVTPNVRGAEALGMRGVLFTEMARTIAAIQAALAAKE